MWEDMADSSKDRKEQRSPSVSMCRKESVSRGSRPGRRGREKRQPGAMTFSPKHWTATKSSAQGWAADSLVVCLPSMPDTLVLFPVQHKTRCGGAHNPELGRPKQEPWEAKAIPVIQ